MVLVRVPTVQVVHQIPGRIRLRIPALSNNPGLVERILSAGMAHPGVRSVRVNLACASVVVEGEPRESPRQLIREWLNASSVSLPASANKTMGLPRPRTEARLVSIGLSLAGIALSAFSGWGSGIALSLTLMGAMPIARRAIHALFVERRVTVDQLDAVAVGLMASVGDVRGAGLMSALVALGEEIRDRTARRSSTAALDLQTALGKSAWLVRGGEKVRVPLDQIQVTDIVVVYPGDLIPVDGIVVDGTAMVDQKMLTGESTPILKSPGARVLAGTVVLDGKIYATAEAVGLMTRAGSIVQLLEHAPVTDSRSAGYAERFATRLVLPTFALAGLAFAVTGNLAQAIAILIVDFATGIRVSAPTSIMATLSRAARDGVLIKGGRAIEQLATANAIVFDKTGTLTSGEPRVFRVLSEDTRYPAEVILALAAAAEMRLRHPAAEAVVRYAQQHDAKIPPRGDMQYTPGLGVSATIEGQEVRVGSERFMAAAGLHLNGLSSAAGRLKRAGASMVFVAIDGTMAGLIAYRDPVRSEAETVIRQLRARGIHEILLVTGDEATTAHSVARSLGIGRVEAGVLPDEKAAIVRELQRRGHVVAVVGDGINDSPALAHADVSVSLSHGADIARETADVILMESNLSGLVHAIDQSRRCIGLINQNLAIVGVPNAAALALATMGSLSPVGSTLLNNGSTVIAALNSLRPLVRENGFHLDTSAPPGTNGGGERNN